VTAPEWFEGPVGERPEVTIARVVEEIDELQATGDCLTLALNRSAAWQQHSEGLQQQIDHLTAELDLVTRERDELLRKIDAACTARDEANARYYATQRTGW
jgi:chromosome segregation ATPase